MYAHGLNEIIGAVEVILSNICAPETDEQRVDHTFKACLGKESYQ